jgi:membrane associated rhomboid family serine protease
MGIYDRDYYRAAPRGSFGSFRVSSITTWLVILNVAVFLVDSLLLHAWARREFPDVPPQFIMRGGFMGPIEFQGHYSIDLAIHQLQLWRFVSYQFLHANFMHLFFNMFGLYLFGPIVESYLGARRYLAYYLLCGCSGAVVYTLLYYLGILWAPDAATPMVGASAAIYGVLVAGAVLTPDTTVMLIFPPIPIQLRYLAIIMVGLAAYAAFNNGHNAGGEAAHLGGAVLGFVLIRYRFAFNPFAAGAPARAGARRRRARTQFKDWSKDMNR